MKKNVVIVDDDRSLRELLQIILEKEGYNVYSFNDGAEAIKNLSNNIADIDVIISDIIMPQMDGLTFLSEIKKLDNEMPVIMITANTKLDYAVQALNNGAYDYITKPFKNDELKIIIKNAIERRNLYKENAKLKELLQKEEHTIVFSSKIMEETYLKALAVAKTDSSVLIVGESGTGKELFGRLIHSKSSRREGPFFAINCSAIPEALMESEFFGYERGAFTGANYSKPGYFELANKGTLFLDELGELPLSMQAKLLRAIEEKTILRLGGKEPISVDIRIISATNKNLSEEVQNGKFREDLFYRLNVVNLNIPPLRERKEDILTLAMQFLKKCSKNADKNIKGFTKDVINVLENYSWPGNVRELQNVVERACVFETGELIGMGSLPIELLKAAETRKAKDEEANKWEEFDFKNFNLDEYLKKTEQRIIELALKKTGGNKKQAADLLGISLWALYHRIEKKIDNG